MGGQNQYAGESIPSGNFRSRYRISLRGNFNGKQEELEIEDNISYSIFRTFYARVSAPHANGQSLERKTNKTANTGYWFFSEALGVSHPPLPAK